MLLQVTGNKCAVFTNIFNLNDQFRPMQVNQLLLPLSLVITALFTEWALRSYIKRLKRAGRLSRDYHKREEIWVPEPVGPAVVIPFVSMLLILSGLTDNYAFLGIAAATSLGGIIGIVDDLINLSAISKPALLLLTPLPLMVLGVLTPRPLLPVVGRARLYYVYWLILPIMFSIFANAINMMDALNGLMPASVIISLVLLLPTLNPSSQWVTLLLIASLTPYYIKNKYPAKAFGGDTLSLAVGSAIASIAATSNREVFFFMALIPFMVSGFVVIASVKGLRERREMKRPVVVRDGVLYVNKDLEAPMTLIAVLVSQRGKDERLVVKEIVALTALSSLLSLLTYFLFTPR